MGSGVSIVINNINVLLMTLELKAITELFLDKSESSTRKLISGIILVNTIFAVNLLAITPKEIRYISIVSIVIALILSYIGEWKKKVGVLLGAVLLNYLVEKPMCLCIDYLLGIHHEYINIDELVVRISAIFMVTILSLIYRELGMREQESKSGRLDIRLIICASLSIGGLMVIGYISLMYYGRQFNLVDMNEMIFRCIYGIIMLLVTVMVIYVQKINRQFQEALAVLKQRHLEQESKLYKQLGQMKTAHCNFCAKLIEAAHNAQEYILVQDKSGVDKCLEQMTSMVDVKEPIVTGNETVDAIVNEKYAVACEKDIDMSINMSLPNQLNMSKVDLCMMLTNSIDDAMIYAEKHGNRSIKIEGIWLKGYLMIKVWSNIGKLQSDYHIANDRMNMISAWVKKHEGFVDVSIENEWRKVEINFNVPNYRVEI